MTKTYKTKLLKNPKLAKLIKYFGNEYKLAAALGLDICNLYRWASIDSIPALHAIRLEKLTKGKMTAKWLVSSKLTRKP